MSRARSAAWWLAPPLLCLALYWRCFGAWFRGDDFAWLSLNLDIHGFHDLLSALFRPAAQGTIRPWSERLFFMAGYGLFGLNALPFRIVVFATHFANLALAASIGARLTGKRAAGFWAAALWTINSALVFPLGWTCVYNQVLCGFFLLLAFYFLLRYVETGAARYNAWQWVAFLLGFGALEINLVYPGIAAAFTWLCARKYFRRTLPLFVPSVIYGVVHHAAAPLQQSGVYAMHFTGAMFRTLGKYWVWSLAPGFTWTLSSSADRLYAAGAAAISAALLLFLAWRFRARAPVALFCLLWFLATIGLVLPLRDHLTNYYLYLPLIGLSWLGGWALAEAWRPGIRGLAGVILVSVYAAMNTPYAVDASDWNYRVSLQVQKLVEGVAGAHQVHPGKAILLTGVDGDMFWSGVLHHPFRLIGVEHVYLAPGAEAAIASRPALGNPDDFVLPAAVVLQGLGRDELEVYDASGPRLRNITSLYAARPPEARPPLRVDVGNPMIDYLLGPGWWANDNEHRWMSRRATLRMGAPAAPGQQLYLSGNCAEEQLRTGPLTVTVSINGYRLQPGAIQPGEYDFHLSFPLPASVAGQPEMEVAVEVARTFRPPGERRDLGLAFGVFEVR